MVNKWDCWDMWNHHRIRWLTHKKKVNKIVGNKSTSYILKHKYFHAMVFCNNDQWIYIVRFAHTTMVNIDQNVYHFSSVPNLSRFLLCCLPVLQQKRDTLIIWNVRRWHDLFARDFQDVLPRALLAILQSWIWRYEKDIFNLWKYKMHK